MSRNASLHANLRESILPNMVAIRLTAHRIGEAGKCPADVPVGAARLDSGEEAPEQKIWEDERCHQRRGLPKASVISVTGANERDQSRLEASLRHIGLELPTDEIVPGQSLTAGRDGAGRFFAAETRTSRSHVTILLKIYLTDCTL